EQFSKSRGTAVWVPDILEKFDADAIRYYLSINMPENKDTDWDWDDFFTKNNDELVGAYGNFVHRVLTFTSKNFGEIPKQKNKLDDLDKETIKKIDKTSEEVSASVGTCNFKKGLRAAMSLAQYGNYYFDKKQPWALIKTDEDDCAHALHICLKITQALSVLMAPYMPFSSEKIWKLFGHNESVYEVNWDEAYKIELKTGIKIEKPMPLFKKLLKEEYIVEEDLFSKIDLRVAKVLAVKDHPEADKLYMINLDLGDLGKRVIVAGMKPYYTKEELKGKNIVIVANLKPANIRGIRSDGMLLAAEDDAGVVSLLSPGDADPGSEVVVDGIQKQPGQVVEFDDFKKISMTINENREAIYNNKNLTGEKGKIVSDKKVKKGAKVL
ncbi:MAG: class I tRNA ligase family protein, partial [Thermoplasmatales archaeon]